MTDEERLVVRAAGRAMICVWCILLAPLAALLVYSFLSATDDVSTEKNVVAVAPTLPVKEASSIPEANYTWIAPDTNEITHDEQGELIRYGRNLVAHTARFIGPRGIISKGANGMNCQNCHLDAGTRYLGNNYSAVASTYPKFRARSGSIENIEKRVNDCIERSLNGKPLAADSREMKAFIAYISWVGKDVPSNVVPHGAGLYELSDLERAADRNNGKLVFARQCTRCHGVNGEGIMGPDGIEWQYPPLWGRQSFNTGAGLFRVSRMASYVKANMPFDLASADKPVLTDEEAWDVAAYIISLPRPHKGFPADWPDISKKPADHPFGPYADAFSESEHKYGPFGPIKKGAKQRK